MSNENISWTGVTVTVLYDNSRQHYRITFRFISIDFFRARVYHLRALDKHDRFFVKFFIVIDNAYYYELTKKHLHRSNNLSSTNKHITTHILVHISEGPKALAGCSDLFRSETAPFAMLPTHLLFSESRAFSTATACAPTRYKYTIVVWKKRKDKARREYLQEAG